MKEYKKPQVVNVNKHDFQNKEQNKFSMLPSVAALTGAAYMVARSMSSFADAPILPSLQRKFDGV